MTDTLRLALPIARCAEPGCSAVAGLYARIFEGALIGWRCRKHMIGPCREVRL